MKQKKYGWVRTKKTTIHDLKRIKKLKDISSLDRTIQLLLYKYELKEVRK